MLRFVVRLVPVAVAVVVLGSACGDGAPAASGGAGVDALDGRTFLSSGAWRDGEPVELVPGTRVRLTFEAGAIGAYAGCNSAGGPYRLDGSVLVVDELATTEMGCDPPRHDQDAWLASLLASRPTVELDGPVLRLWTATEEIELVDRAVADPDRALEGTAWELDTLLQGAAASTPPAGYEAVLLLEPDGRLSVAGSCNQFHGSWRAAQGVLEVDAVASTRVGCPPEVAEVERLLVFVLEGRPTIAVEAATLVLVTEDGVGLGFRAD
jgi:heat shock protein HslJ